MADNQFNTLLKLGLLFGQNAFIYLSSLWDAGITARDEFLFPTFVEIATGGAGIFVSQVQTNDTHAEFDPALLAKVRDGINSLGYGFNIELLFEGRKYFFSFGLNFAQAVMYLEFTSSYRFLTRDSLLLGLGFMTSVNMSREDNIYWQEDPARLKPFPNEIYTPALSLALRSTSLELDLFASPFALVSTAIFHQTGSDNSAKAEVATVPMLGVNGKVAVNFFFNLNVGIRLAVNYMYMWNMDHTLAEQGFTVAESTQFLLGKLGLVYRF